MKRFLVIVGIVLISIIALSFVGLTFISYQLLDEVAPHKTNSKTKNNTVAIMNKEVIGVSQSEVVSSSIVVVHSQAKSSKEDDESDDDFPSVEQFLSINRLKDELQNVEMPELCSVICEPTRFEFTKEKKQPIYDVIDYYNKEGARALSDPKFRITYHRSIIMGQIFSPTIMDLIKEADDLSNDENSKNEAKKLWLASRIVPTIMYELNTMQRKLKDSKPLIEYFDKVEKLAKKCAANGPELTIKDCQQLAAKVNIEKPQN